MKPFQAHGVIVPTLTPFSPGGEQIDEGAFLALNQWLIERGVAGLMPCGTTGEGMLLTTAERRRLLELTVHAAAGQVAVMAHVGAIGTAETMGLAHHAVECGADAVSVVTPYYYSLGNDDIMEHFCAVAEAVPQMPVFLYNIPQCTINRVTLPIVQAVIARCPNVVGIKDSSGDLLAISQYVELRGGAFQVMNGHDGALLPALKLGARGAVSGNSNVVPEIVCAVTSCWAAGDADGAAAAFARMGQARELLAGSIALLKHGLNLRGVLGGDVRPPQGPAPDVAVERLEALLPGLLG
jgi:4-hydroxy-tetrahydrodipicolinate synthase